MQLIAVEDLPEISSGDDLPAILAKALTARELADDDVIVVTQKIVSKAEGRFVSLADIAPSREARDLAKRVDKDPALVELVLCESSAIIRAAPNVLITRHRSGHVMANAGIDASNVGSANEGRVLLLPIDSDASAEAIQRKISQDSDVSVGVVISDSFGRPWRIGTTDFAIGVAGMPAYIDRRGEPDRDGRVMQVTQVAAADAIAAAAGLIMGEGAEGIPVVILRGWQSGDAPHNNAQALLRPQAEDLFR